MNDEHLDATVLAELAVAAGYALDIADRIHWASGIQLSPTQVYGSLSRLETRGLVVGFPVRDHESAGDVWRWFRLRSAALANPSPW